MSSILNPKDFRKLKDACHGISSTQLFSLAKSYEKNDSLAGAILTLGLYLKTAEAYVNQKLCYFDSESKDMKQFTATSHRLGGKALMRLVVGGEETAIPLLSYSEYTTNAITKLALVLEGECEKFNNRSLEDVTQAALKLKKAFKQQKGLGGFGNFFNN